MPRRRRAIDAVADRAAERGATSITGRYVPTPRNALVRDHYRDLGFSAARADGVDGGETRWVLRLADHRRSDPSLFRRVE